MSFESGSISCRMFYVPKDLPTNAVSLFAKHAAPPIDTLSDGEINGWVSGRHLLDRKITEQNAFYGGFLRLTLMQAERKIPDSLLRAECKMEELAQMEADGVDRLSQSARSEIRRSVTSRLLPQMPPQLKGLPFVYDSSSRILYATALSEKQMDALMIHLSQTLGFGLIPVTPETAAAKRLKVDTRQWGPASYSPELEDGETGGTPGQDFFTWLWLVAEARGGMLTLGDHGSFALMIEGPLLCVMEGGGAHETVLRKGEPMLSAEAKTALLSGKKLRRAKLTITHNERSWVVTLDADQFVFRGLKLPEGEKLDAISRFQDRMLQLDLFREAFLQMYDLFIAERNDAKRWAETQKEIHAWVSGRKVRK